MLYVDARREMPAGERAEMRASDADMIYALLMPLLTLIIFVDIDILFSYFAP
jgi:hypothetical protein